VRSAGSGSRLDRASGCLFRVDGASAAEPMALGLRAFALLTLLLERQATGSGSTRSVQVPYWVG
jgi:succinate-acetate transporter protein